MGKKYFTKKFIAFGLPVLLLANPSLIGANESVTDDINQDQSYEADSINEVVNTEEAAEV